MSICEVRLRSFFLACLLAPWANRAADAGTVYFVSPDGKDAAAGSAAHPRRTVAKALTVVKLGDTVRMLAGTYRDKVTINLSGAEGQPITIEGQRGPKGEWLTSLDPSVPLVAKWTAAPEVGEGVYKMPLPGFEPFLMLVDGKFIPRVWPDHMADGLGFKKMAYAPDQQAAPLPRNGEWNHVAIIRQDGQVNFCLNGVVHDAGRNEFDFDRQTDFNLYHGLLLGGGFAGAMDDLRIYRRALPPGQIPRGWSE